MSDETRSSSCLFIGNDRVASKAFRKVLSYISVIDNFEAIPSCAMAMVSWPTNRCEVNTFCWNVSIDWGVGLEQFLSIT